MGNVVAKKTPRSPAKSLQGKNNPRPLSEPSSYPLSSLRPQYAKQGIRLRDLSTDPSLCQNPRANAIPRPQTGGNRNSERSRERKTPRPVISALELRGLSSDSMLGTPLTHQGLNCALATGGLYAACALLRGLQDSAWSRGQKQPVSCPCGLSIEQSSSEVVAAPCMSSADNAAVLYVHPVLLCPKYGRGVLPESLWNTESHHVQSSQLSVPDRGRGSEGKMVE
jgi:hypothetical protein